MNCGMRTGALFFKKPCANAGLLVCTECKQHMCNDHAVPQQGRVIYCRDCDARLNPVDDRYDDTSSTTCNRGDAGWSEPSLTSATAVSSDAAAASLDDRDKDSFRDGAAYDSGAAAGDADSGFDAS